MIQVSDLKTAWHDCPHCKKKIIVVVSNSDNELELFTEKEYDLFVGLDKK